MSPCESPGRMSRSRSKNMNHCGQSPSGFCCRITRSSRSRIGGKRPSARSSSTGPWATSRVPQPAAGVLLEASRRQVMHERVVCEPRHDVRDAGERLLEGARIRNAHRQSRNDALIRFRTNRRGYTLGQQVTSDAQSHDPTRRGDDTYIGLLAGPPVDEEQLVPADLLELRSRRGADVEAAVREAPSHVRIRNSCHDDVGAFSSPPRRTRRASVVAVQGHVMRDQAARRYPRGEFHRKPELLRFARRLGSHPDLSGSVSVDPAALVG